ncbi:hypothetical protein RJ641_012805 [Dillenia turbinata]|uniref:Late embryogenesis abundant protein LEA-2 subgroup domain-containing protein n=1 Tax=Dillenia turbinata TaxID=194707 RepID=A0AAN8USE1_9MAGN
MSTSDCRPQLQGSSSSQPPWLEPLPQYQDLSGQQRPRHQDLDSHKHPHARHQDLDSYQQPPGRRQDLDSHRNLQPTPTPPRIQGLGSHQTRTSPPARELGSHQHPYGRHSDPDSHWHPQHQQQLSTGRSRHHDLNSHRGPLIFPIPRKTRPVAWILAAICAIFWLIVILGGLAILIIYLVFRPRSPKFDISTATLNVAYLDMGYLLNADLTLLANFTNPNRKVNVDFSYMYIELYYRNTLIATRPIDHFSVARSETKLANVEMVTSQVQLPLKDSKQLQNQMASNKIQFEVLGFFRTRSKFGSIFRYSYWLYGRCTIVVSSPPGGVLVTETLPEI